MRGRRFERLERARKGGGDSATRAPGIEERFGTVDPTGAAAGPERSGAERARFEEDREKRLRLRDEDSGQTFVRCADCRADNHLSASRCTNCDAELVTPRQRAFNEALWRKLAAEKQEQDEQVRVLKERSDAADREQVEAQRRRLELELDLERRRERGLFRDDVDDFRNPVRALARSAGRFLGETLVRLLPNRTTRLVVLAAGALLLLALVIAFPEVRRMLLYALFVLAALVAGRRRRRGWWWRP